MADRTDAADLETSLFKQRRDLTKAKILDSDLALQLSSSSSSSSSPPNVAVPIVPSPLNLISEEFARLEQEHKDREQSEIETREAREYLSRRVHDDQVAKPFGEGSSSSSAVKKVESESVFRLYFKGLVSSGEMAGNSERVVLAGIGVALCDPRGNLVFEVGKPLNGNGMSKNGAQLKALIEGLNAALALDLKRITFFCENLHIFRFVTGNWPTKQRKIAMLVNQVKSLQGKFIVCKPRLVPRNDIKFALKLAREAIDSQSQTNQPAQSTACKNVNETCVICLEDTDVSRMFSVDGCLHRYCFTCMKQHVEVKLLHGMIPICPHERCKSELSVDSCAKFLMPKHVETMRQCIKEASIPATERVYCPYPRCSALMSKREILGQTKETSRGVELSGVRTCKKCNSLFCINCKVPWHRNKTCPDYKRLNPHSPEEDMKLKFLASSNQWRECVKCNHMIELSEGCYHITCRCGHQFCYNCGAEWKDKKATCSCPLWDERNILHHEDEEEMLESEPDEDDIVLEDDILSNEDIDFEEEGFDENDGGLDDIWPVEDDGDLDGVLGDIWPSAEDDGDDGVLDGIWLPAEDDGDLDDGVLDGIWPPAEDDGDLDGIWPPAEDDGDLDDGVLDGIWPPAEDDGDLDDEVLDGIWPPAEDDGDLDDGVLDGIWPPAEDDGDDGVLDGILHAEDSGDLDYGILDGIWPAEDDGDLNDGVLDGIWPVEDDEYLDEYLYGG